MYLLKTKGTTKIPDYVQVRDNNFALINHITLNKINEYIDTLDIDNKQKIKDIIKKYPFGKIIKID